MDVWRFIHGVVGLFEGRRSRLVGSVILNVDLTTDLQ